MKTNSKPSVGQIIEVLEGLLTKENILSKVSDAPTTQHMDSIRVLEYLLNLLKDGDTRANTIRLLDDFRLGYLFENIRLDGEKRGIATLGVRPKAYLYPDNHVDWVSWLNSSGSLAGR